jgi:hypothetical protein
MVNAERVEELAISALKGLLADRMQVKQAILSLGLYSEETASMLRRGPLACRRISAMDRFHLRALFLALVPRADACPTGLTMQLSCFELSRFLGWDGIGIFQKSVLRPSHAVDRVHEVRAPAFLICGHPYFALPIEPCPVSHPEPNPTLVDLVTTAAEYREFVLANRSRTIVDLAHEKGMGATQFARLLRLNYLAPDIQAAIIDGTQPSTLSRWTILHGPMPLDWEQQRQLMGFI